jgi:DNA-directed RNA polymerase subunit beta
MSECGYARIDFCSPMRVKIRLIIKDKDSKAQDSKAAIKDIREQSVYM